MGLLGHGHVLSSFRRRFHLPHSTHSIAAVRCSHNIWVRADIPGYLTGVGGLVLVNLAWNRAPAVGLDKPYVYVLLIVGLIFLGIFGQAEKRAKFPLVPIASMTADIGYILACVACGWAAFVIWIYYPWQLMEQL